MSDGMMTDDRTSAELAALRRRVVELEQIVAESRRLEDELRRKTAEQKVLLDSIPALVYYKDRSHRYITGNRAFAEKTGMPVEALAGKTDFELFSATEAQEYIADDETVMAAGEARMNAEMPVTRPDGSPGWIAAYNIPYRGPHGDVIGLVGISIDITERKLAEEALQRKSTELQMLLDINPALVYFKDRNHRYLIVNRAFATAAGRPIDEIIGKTDFEVFVPSDAEIFIKSDEEVMAAGQPQMSVEEPLTRADGSRSWIAAYKVPYFDAAGHTLGMVGIAIDITERKQAEVALQRSESELRALVEQQQRLIETIRELSTPVLPIFDQTLVLPLIGHIDSARSMQITETLLAAVQRQHAAIVIIDITGVPVVDTAVANHIVQATRAVALLGARCVLVGISPEIAQTLVQLGVDLSTLITRSDLQAGITYALAHRVKGGKGEGVKR
jgi:rsbT co-antagonist protein RsbR